MKTKLYTTFFLLSLLIFSGCHSEEVAPKEEYYSIKLDGKYDLVGLMSETAVDLDHDGVFSEDIIAETNMIAEPTFLKNMARYFMELD